MPFFQIIAGLPAAFFIIGGCRQLFAPVAAVAGEGHRVAGVRAQGQRRRVVRQDQDAIVFAGRQATAIPDTARPVR